MPTLGPFTREHFTQPTPYMTTMAGVRSNKVSSAGTPPEDSVEGLKSVRHTLLELPA